MKKLVLGLGALIVVCLFAYAIMLFLNLEYNYFESISFLNINGSKKMSAGKEQDLNLGEEFALESKRKLERNKELISKAEKFDQAQLLSSLGQNKKNGFYYRLDDNLHRAIIKSLGNTEKSQSYSKYIYEMNFDEKNKSMQVNNAHFDIQNGFMKTTQNKSSFLESVSNIEIPARDIGAVEVRMKVNKGEKGRLFFHDIDDKKMQVFEGGAVGLVNTYDGILNLLRIEHLLFLQWIDLNLTPDGKFHTYRIKTTNLFNDFPKHFKIRKLLFKASDQEGDNVEIDYIKFISSSAKYKEKICSLGYEKIMEEMRKVIYLNAPLRLTYKLELPKEETYLSFGIGGLIGGPLAYKISVVDEDNDEQQIFTKKIDDNKVWHDTKLDLSKWSGEAIELIFEISGNNNDIGLLSNPIVYSKPSKRFNVVILLEDALRADHVANYGLGKKLAPALNNYANKGVRFFNAFSQATQTRPSCPSFMTSLYPTVTGVKHFADVLSEKFLTLPEVMRSQGFATGAFIQNPNAGPAVGLGQGYSEIYNNARLGWNAHSFYGKTLFDWFNVYKDRNFFIYLHLMDPHAPYNPPPPFNSDYIKYEKSDLPKDYVKKRKLFDPEWMNKPSVQGRKILYSGEVKYNDYFLQIFLDKLAEMDLLDNTLFIFIADHGEFLGEHDMWGHHPPGYKEVLNVPFIMVYPKKLPEGKIILEPVQLLDMMPTVLELAEIDTKDMLLQGDSLVSLMNGDKQFFWQNRICISEEAGIPEKFQKHAWGSVLYRKQHYLYSEAACIDHNQNSELLKKCDEFHKFYYWPTVETDNYENKLSINKAEVKKFLLKLYGSDKKINNLITQGIKTKIEYDAETVEKLKALGYVQ